MRVRTPTAALALALGLFLFVLVIAAIFIWQGHRDALRQGEQRAAIASQIVAVHFQWLIETSRQALRRIDDTLGYRPELLLAAQLGDLDDAIQGLPADVEARLFDRFGREILSTTPRGEINIADRPYFEQLSEGAPQVISPLLIDRVTGDRSFVVGRRLTRGDEFVGIAAIVVPTQLMSDVWQNLQLGPQSAISVIANDGWLVARHPEAPESSTLAPQVLPPEQQGRESGTYRSISPLDSVERLVGFHHISNGKLVAFAAIATSSALADFRQRVTRISIVAVPVFLGLLGFALWVSQLLIVDQRRAKELEESANQNKTLLREIHHRVKNNLQTVASLVRLQPLPDGAKRDLSSRIAAMAMVHEQIYRADRFATIDLDEYLQQLVLEIKASFGSDVAMELKVATTTVDADKAMIIGLIVTEVISNSLKYAFPEGKGGLITLALDTPDEAHSVLSIRDNGVGFDPQKATSGLGLKLISRFVQQLEATFTIEGKGGLHFVLKIPQPIAETR